MPLYILDFENKSKKLQEGLAHVKDNESIFKSLTTLQNEISVYHKTKVIAVTGIKDEALAAAFAKGLAEAYSLNGSSSLIIDANLYNPSLLSFLGESDGDVSFKEGGKDFKLTFIDENTKAICLDKEIYPSIVFKSGLIQKTIKDNESKYEHFIVIVPDIKEHKEVTLLGDVVDSIILVTQKNITVKKHIFDALEFFRENNLPLAKTVVLK